MSLATLMLTILYAGLSYVLLELTAKRHFKALPTVTLVWGCLAATALIMAGSTGTEAAVILVAGSLTAALMYVAVRRGGQASA